jgi:hypothetical protein
MSSGPPARKPAAVRVGQLEAGQAKVEQAAVHEREPGGRGDRRQVPEVRLPEDESIAEPGVQPLPDSGDGRPIGVKAEEAAIRVARLQDPLGVPTAAQRGIDLKAARSWREHRHDLLRQHRQVRCLHLSSIPNDRIPSGPWKRMWLRR